MSTIYRGKPRPPSSWALALARGMSWLRGSAHFRRWLGGVWELHAALRVPGMPETWYRVGLDLSPLHSNVVDREVYL